MKKIGSVLAIIFFGIVFSFLMPLIPVSAMHYEDLPGSGFYASPEEKEEIEKLISSDRWPNAPFDIGVEPAKGKYYPFYTFDILEYARTGIFSFGISEEYRDYYVKMVTKEGGFACEAAIRFREGQGGYFTSAKLSFRTKTKEQLSDPMEITFSPASFDYADNAERIRELLGRETVLPESCVRLVRANYGGDQFIYINAEENEYVYSPGLEYYPEFGELYGMSEENDCFKGSLITLKEYKSRAEYWLDLHEEKERERAEWAKEHPDLPWNYDGKTGGAATTGDVAPDPSATDPSVTAPVATVATPVATAGFTWQTGVAMGAVAVLVLGAAFALSRSRKET